MDLCELYIDVVAQHATLVAEGRIIDQDRMARYGRLVDTALDTARTEYDGKVAFDREALHAVVCAHRRAQYRVWSTICDRLARAAITVAFERTPATVQRLEVARELAERVVRSTGTTVTVDARQTVRAVGAPAEQR